MHSGYFLTFLFLSQCNSAIYEGVLKTPSQWHYLSKFCFSNQFGGNGQFDYTIIPTSPPRTLKIMIYLGMDNATAEGAWDPVYAAREILTCQQKVDRHRKGGYQTIVSGRPGTFVADVHVRPYFWYVAVADCDAVDGLDFRYRLSFLNPGGLWWEHFSYDEQGVCQYYIFFTVFYLILLLVHLWGVWKLIRLESWHPIIKILTIALVFQFLSCFFEMVHYLIYMKNGIGSPDTKALGELLTMTTQIMMMFLCILVAKGWTITISSLYDQNIIMVSIYLMLASYVSLFIWDSAATNPASTLYFYDSIPGLIVIFVRFGVTAWFLYSLRSTMGLEVFPDKRRFYIIFGFCYTIWFLLFPGIVAFALAFEPWFRFRSVRGMSLISDTLAFIAFVVLLWPSRVASYFKFNTTPQLMSEDQKNGYGSTYTDDL